MLTSAGILAYRRTNGRLEVLLAHNGGPFFAKRDDGWWTIPKGLVEEGEDRFETAKREFTEELSLPPPQGNYIDIGTITQRNYKQVYAWAVEIDLDPSQARSNTFELEWPPRSGTTQTFPEIDKVQWFTVAQARAKMTDTQLPFIDRLLENLGITDDHDGEQVTLL